MKTTFAVKLFAAASACLLLAIPVQASNLLLNPGFEESNLGLLPWPYTPPEPWFSPVVADNVLNGQASVVAINTHSGNKALEVRAPWISPGTGEQVYQTVSSLIPGQQYILDVWAMAVCNNTNLPAMRNHLSAKFGALPAQAVIVTTGGLYAEYSFTLTVPMASDPNYNRLCLWWGPLNPQNLLYLDDASLTVVPEPSTAALLLLAFGVAVMRMPHRPRPA